MNNKLVLLIASICTLTHVARAEAGVAVVPDGTWRTYWSGQYPWCEQGPAAGALLFVCRRNVRIVPIEGTTSLTQLGLLWKERSTVAGNQVAVASGTSEKTVMVYKLRRMWTTATSNLEKCGGVAACGGVPVKNQWYTDDVNTDGFSDTAR